MKVNHWTLALAAAGVVSFGAAAQADEANETVRTLVSGTTLSGYVSTSMIWRPGTGTGYYGSVAANNAAGAGAAAFHSHEKHDGFNLDVIDIKISKDLDESEWAAGYVAELWFGPDAKTFATMMDTGANNDVVAIKNAYVTLRAPLGNGLDFKLGVWDTIVGFESANAGDNPNYTRSLAWSVEPTTHTGLLMSYRFNDLVSASVGIANGSANPGAGNINTVNFKGQNSGFAANDGSESAKQYMASVTLTAPDDWGFISGSSLTAAVINTPRSGVAGTTGAVQDDDEDMTHIYVGAALNTPIEAWKVGVAYDYVANRALASGLANAHASDYTSIFGLYNSYQATEKLKVNVRAEYATGSAGAFVPGVAASAADGDPGQAFFALTGTVDYALWENVISRLELRWDTALHGGAGSGAGSPDNPFGGTTSGSTGIDEKNAFLVALNVIYKF